MPFSTQVRQQYQSERAIEKPTMTTMTTLPQSHSIPVDFPLKITTPEPLSIAMIAATISAPALYVHNPYGSGDMVYVGRAERKNSRNARRSATEEYSANVAGSIGEDSVGLESADSTGDSGMPIGYSQSCFAVSPASSVVLSVECEERESAQSHSGQSEEHTERKRRPRKSRKNRSAGLVGDNGQRVTVCLDYLKGVCNKKRSRCKFAHPQLSLDAPAPVPQQIGVAAPAQVRVCEVWALTGFCKFGGHCRDYHPAVEEPITKVCAPATTVRMSKTSREAAGRLRAKGSQSGSDDGHNSDEAPLTPPVSAGTGPGLWGSGTYNASPPMPWWGEVDGLLMHLSNFNFDVTLKRLVSLLWSPEGLRIETLLPILFGKAIENFDRLVVPMANLCRHLCDLYPEAQRHEFQAQLLRLADRVLYLTYEGMDAKDSMSLRRKQRGTVHFVSELFKLSLVPPVRLQSALDYCINRGSSPSDDGNLFIEFASTFLRVVGPSVTRVLDLERTVKRLNEFVVMHQQRRAMSYTDVPMFSQYHAPTMRHY